MFLRAFTPILLDLVSTLVFVATYWLSENVALATILGVAAGVSRFVIIKLRRQAVGPLQYLSIVIVLATGVTTLLTRNPQYVMLKSSLIALAVGAVMLSTNWMAPYLPAIVTENIDARTIGRTSAGWGLLQIALAIANAVVALAFGIKVWSVYAATVPNLAIVAAFAINFLVFRILIGRRIRGRRAAQSAGAENRAG